MSLQSRIDYSIALLRKAEPLALNMNHDGFHLAFSGGKDSQVLYHIAQMAGVKFKAHMQITTLDPPELMRFIRANYPDVELHRPPLNFYQLLEKKGCLPTRGRAWCCEALKEHAGAGCLTLTGIRAAESNNRKNRGEISRLTRNKERRKVRQDLFDISEELQHQCIKGGKGEKVVLSPIFHWSEADVWDFIKWQGLPYCELYDKGNTRIGCIMCTKSRKSERDRERVSYPGVERAIIRSIDRILKDGRMKPVQPYNPTADEVFSWWLSGLSVKKYFENLRQQTKLDI